MKVWLRETKSSITRWTQCIVATVMPSYFRHDQRQTSLKCFLLLRCGVFESDGDSKELTVFSRVAELCQRFRSCAEFVDCHNFDLKGNEGACVVHYEGRAWDKAFLPVRTHARSLTPRHLVFESGPVKLPPLQFLSKTKRVNGYDFIHLESYLLFRRSPSTWWSCCLDLWIHSSHSQDSRRAL